MTYGLLRKLEAYFDANPTEELTPHGSRGETAGQGGVVANSTRAGVKA